MSDARLMVSLGLRFAGAALAVTARRVRSGPLRPGWSWSEEWIATGMRRHFAAIEGLPWPEQRRSFSLMAPRISSLSGIIAERGTLGGRPALWISPTSGASPPVRTLFYLHGGAYLFGRPDDYAELLSALVRRAGLRAVAIDYRLAPEHPFPAALADAIAAWEALLAIGVSPSEIVLAGDSAGGGLALALMVALRDAGRPLPAGAGLICPWVDLTAAGGSIEAFTGIDVFTPSMIRGWAREVLAGAAADDPRASPLFADLSGLPPLMVQIGGAEMLRDQDERLAARAQAAGTEVTVRIWRDCIHDFPVYAAVIPDGREARVELAEFLASVGRAGELRGK